MCGFNHKLVVSSLGEDEFLLCGWRRFRHKLIGYSLDMRQTLLNSNIILVCWGSSSLNVAPLRLWILTNWCHSLGYMFFGFLKPKSCFLKKRSESFRVFWGCVFMLGETCGLWFMWACVKLRGDILRDIVLDHWV